MVVAPVLSLLLVAFVSLLLIQVGARALRFTGLDPDVALLQAQSAFTGTGWTTAEAELVMNHPLRRRIIRHLMLVGALGIPSVIATVVVLALSISRTEGTTSLLSIPAAAGGLLAIWLVLHSRPIEAVLDWGIRLSLRRVGRINPVDYAQMLRVHAGFSVGEWIVEAGSPLVGRPLRDSRPGDHGVLVLGVERAGGGWVGAPNKDTVIQAGDTLTVYGPDEAIARFLDTPSGSEASGASPRR